MDSPYCPIESNPRQEVVFTEELVLFSRSAAHQGALRHSGIIVPRAHRATVFDLTEEELLATFALLRRVKAWLDELHRPDGYNVGWNCGPVGGQKVMHAHLHVIPRFAEEPLAGAGIRTYLASDANRR